MFYRWRMVAGRLSYYIYIVTGLVFLSAAWRTAQRSLAQPEGAAGVLARLTSPWETATRIAAEVWAQPWLPAGLLLGFAIAYALTLLVEARMSAHFSGFWFVKQEELRDGLKQARLDLKAAQAAVPSPAPGRPHDEELVTARVASLF